MGQVKIISNPYLKNTSFQSWNEAYGGWIDIDQDTNSNSGLLKADLRTGFFPFKVRQIVDVLISEYATDSEKVEIVFEGTDDEFKELETICNGEAYSDKVNVDRSDRYLENARDILPDIIDVFKDLKPFLSASVSDKDIIKRELDRFADASNDVVPICIIGNYSSGKSTFINALIGYELLPSSDEPTTAKVYRIAKSQYSDRATIKFECDDKIVRIRFTADDYRFATDADASPLSREIEETLERIAQEAIPVKLRTTLETINSYANREEEDSISDLIEVEAPFEEDGLWNRIQNRFVIFDTPGSNSASNQKHYQVLKKAMADLSNGLPIFLSEFDSLDSTDNDKLYQDINNMDELDNRFTMIIVNKSDAASLKKSGYTDADRERILGLAIPRKLCSGGIYFVSSIMGLGSKNAGDFIDDHNAEIFEDQYVKYSDPNSRFYKNLYRYNILPAQIKQRQDALSEKHQNLIYANSGLYSVEQAIETFASVYSHYNKCQQSHLFLRKVIQITSDEIAASKSKKESYTQHLCERLEKEKAELLSTIDQNSAEMEAQYLADYPGYMEEPLHQVKDSSSVADLREEERTLRTTKSEEKDIKAKEEEVRDSRRSRQEQLKANVGSFFKERSVESLRKIGADFSKGASEINEKKSILDDTKQSVDKESSDDLLFSVKQRFFEKWNSACKVLESASRCYWEVKIEAFKKSLLDIVTQSTALSEQQRSKLADIIILYQELSFAVSTEEIFDKNAFLKRIFGDSNRLNIDKISKRYNSEMEREVLQAAKNYYESHAASFSEWKNSLLSVIRENIVELNPDLHSHSEIISEETAKIADLESRMRKLKDYTEQIQRMMAWKES